MATDKATTQLAQFECQRRGWHLEETNWTERFPKGGKLVTVSRDLFGILDGIVFLDKPLPNGVYTIGLQWTEAGHANARINKISKAPIFRRLRRAQWEVRVWGFDTHTGVLKIEQVAGPLPV